MTANLVSMGAGQAPLNVKVQRCYTKNLRGQIFATNDNSAKNVTFENVWANTWSTQTMPVLSAVYRGVVTALIELRKFLYMVHTL
jgi:hypothetical protein